VADCSCGALQIAVREISADLAIAGAPAEPSSFTFEVRRVVHRLSLDEDPDVRLAKALLARSRHNGPQEELWIANSIARVKEQGRLAPLDKEVKHKGMKRFRAVAAHVSHIAQAVAQLNKLKLRLNDGVRKICHCIVCCPSLSFLS
jgi:hypothetical protein